MKLNECVQKLDIEDDKYIHIGSSCGYFFVGTKEEYDLLIDKISADYKQKLKDKMELCKRRIKEASSSTSFLPDVDGLKLPTASIRKVDSYCDALMKMSRVIEKKINNRIKSVKYNFNTYHSSKYKLEHWIDFSEREVVEMYKRISGDGIVVIVDGDEMGSAWDRQEFLYGSSDDDEE